MMIGVALLLVAALAFANGANDVSKGIATLVGSGVTNYRRAVAWGTLCTVAGSVSGAMIAGAMLATFGSGIWTGSGDATLTAAVATLIGATAWVLWATWRRLPVSTTHALVGALAGAGAAAWGVAGVRWDYVAMKMALPLLLGPVLALMAAAALTRWTRPRPDCLCIDVAEPTVSTAGAAMTVALPRLSVGEARECRKDGSVAMVTADRLHWLASGATSFARGLNDAPKLVALGLGVVAIAGRGFQPALFAAVALGMGLGSWFAGRRITRVLAERVTAMDHREGLSSNAVTSALVIAGGIFGLPLSTTHVSSGALIGMGMQRPKGAINWGTVRQMGTAWVITLPAAAAMGAFAQLVLGSLS